jgi:hypothetical protein
MFWYMLFGVLWVTAFLRAQSSFITMVSASTYYFDSSMTKPEGEQEGEADVSLAFKFTFMYHSGSLAVGSFIIALIQFIRIIFLTVTQKLKEASGENQLIVCAVKCAECCLKCIEDVCEYISKAAYAYMAVSGDNFFNSALNGFCL